jgi:membrane dipeptidase
MTLDYIDLHCDTAYELYHRGERLERNTCAVSLDGATAYTHYAQFFAVWCNKHLDDEAAWRDFLAISDRFSAELARCERAKLVRSLDGLGSAWQSHRCAALLAVEDARLLNGQLDRLNTLAERGVTYLTLGWSGKSCICASHDVPEEEDTGLTDFGRAVVKRCFEIGIVPDISHASVHTADEVLALAEAAGMPVIATHSNAHAVYPHTRNLRDGHARRLFALGGLVGLNLCKHHLCSCADGHATVDDALRHIDHWLSLGGEHHLAIGGDLDGAALPDGICRVDDVASIGDAMAEHGYSEAIIRRIFSENALDFIRKAFDRSTVG